MPDFFLCLCFFFVSISALDRVPDQSLIRDGQRENGECITAFKNGYNKYSVIYLPVGKKIAVNTASNNAERIKTSWFNPRNGEASGIKVLREKQNEVYSAVRRIRKPGVDY